MPPLMPLPFQLAGLLTAHWVGDFALQTNWMAQHKGERLDALSAHVAVYTLVLAVASALLFGLGSPVAFAGFVALNGVLHFVTDFFTSRLANRYFKSQNWRPFFFVVGLDQLIHQLTLVLTAWAIY